LIICLAVTTWVAVATPAILPGPILPRFVWRDSLPGPGAGWGSGLGIDARAVADDVVVRRRD